MSFTNDSLVKLSLDCQAQIKRYKNDQPSNGSPSCLEILRRAVDGDRAAWDTLLDISKTQIITTYVRRESAADFNGEQEDIIQDVLMRLDNRISRPTGQPYKVGTFSGYWKFVQMAVHSEMIERKKIAARRDQIDKALKEEMVQGPDTTEQFTAEEIRELLQARFQMWAAKASPAKKINILRRWKAIYLRHIIGKTPQEIAQDFQSIDPTITVRQVSRYIERGLDQVRKDAYLRHLFGFSHDQTEEKS